MNKFSALDWCILIVVAGLMIGYVIGIWKHGDKDAIRVLGEEGGEA